MTTGLLVPLYVQPGSLWTSMGTAHQNAMNVPMICVINPNNGDPVPNPAPPGWASGITSMKAAGITVLGYVHSCWANTRCSAQLSYVQQQVTAYKNANYGVTGIFVDEMDNTGAFVSSYYAPLAATIRSLGFNYIIGNPGATITANTVTGSGFDNIVIYESDSGYPSLSTLQDPAQGAGTPANFSYIGLSCPSYEPSFIAQSAPFVQWLYATPNADGASNPYLTFPWVTQILQTLSTLGGGISTSLTLGIKTV